jgi:hypothetical protein
MTDKNKPTKLVQSMIRNYGNRYPTIQREDLEQEAALLSLEAQRYFKDDGPATWVTYINQASRFHFRNWTIMQIAPVTVGHNNVTEVVEMRTAKLPESGSDTPEPFKLTAKPEAQLDSLRAAKELRKLIDSLPHGSLARAVLLDEIKPAIVAKRNRVPVQIVYRAVVSAKQAIAESPQLRALAQE